MLLRKTIIEGPAPLSLVRNVRILLQLPGRSAREIVSSSDSMDLRAAQTEKTKVSEDPQHGPIEIRRELLKSTFQETRIGVVPVDHLYDVTPTPPDLECQAL